MKRSYQDLLSKYIQLFPCVILLGPRQCGKTTLLQTCLVGWKKFDLEKQSDFLQITGDPDLFFRLHSNRVAIDEAQLAPAIFAALRVAIDADRETKGRFVLTGSSSPHLIKRATESLAGRVGIIEMSPFTYKEVAGLEQPSLFALLEQSGNMLNWDEALVPRGNLDLVRRYWWQGGYPEPWLSKDDRFPKVWMDNYVASYVGRDIKQLFPNINEQRFKRFVSLLAGCSGQILNLSEIARSLDVSQPTVKDYLDIAHDTFLWRTIPAWDRDSRKRLVKHPKGYIRDSGLLNHLLFLASCDALFAHPLSGRLWEALVTEEILRDFHNRGQRCEYSYYRTSAGAEIDLILRTELGVVPIEIKLSPNVEKKQLRAISDFLVEQKSPVGIVVTLGERVARLDSHLFAVPFHFL